MPAGKINSKHTYCISDVDIDFLKPRIDRSKLPTAPKAARGPDVDMSKVPTEPPFTAFIGNLAYETTEENIFKFFQKLQVKCIMPEKYVYIT